MYNGLREQIKPEWIGTRNETYPGGVSEGHPGYSLTRAEEIQRDQINQMKVAKNTLDIIVVIEPLHGKRQQGTYCVRNRSTYVK